MAFVTTTCVDWLPIFSHKSVAKLVTLKLGEVAGATHTSIVAYVVMPSHLHALLGFQQIQEMPKFMQRFKSLTARAIKGRKGARFSKMLYSGGEFRLWKRRFDDVIIYSEEQFRIKLDYIHNNPVNAGLVGSSTDWAFSSARDWILDEKGLIVIDKSFSWYE